MTTEITMAEVCSAIARTLGAAEGIVRVQDASQPDSDTGGMTDSMPDVPAIQVYCQSFETTTDGNTDRVTARGGVRVTRMVFNVDLFVKRRGILAEDMAAAQAQAEPVIGVLEAQRVKPYFGLAGIQAYMWRGERTTFDFPDAGQRFAGWRFTITITIF